MKTLKLLLVLMLMAGLASAHVGVEVWGTSRGQGERLLYSNHFEGDTGSWNIPDYLTTVCVIVTRDMMSIKVDCAREIAKLSWSRDVLITRFAMLGLRNVAANPTQNGNDGCSFRLNTGIAGFTPITGGELHVPSSNVLINEGDVYTVDVNVLLPAGTSMTISPKDGDFCEAGTLCVCNDAWNDSRMEIWGIFQ